jgi:hypothetical protein
VLAHAGPRALQRGVHRRDRRLEDLGGLAGRAVQDVAQDEHGARQRREVLDRGEERQLDRLPGDDGVLGAVLAGRQLGEQRVGIGLQPQDLAVGGRHPRALVERVEAGVRRDLVEPGTQRRAALELLAPAPGAQERLLHEVLGLLQGARHPVAVDVQLAGVAAHLRLEGVAVGGGGHGPCDGGAAEAHHDDFCERPASKAP